jgi:hypothetical protein
MGKVWVLDTETKGTGAQMVPLEKVLEKAGPKPGPVYAPQRPAPKPEPDAAPAPKAPHRFRVVDVMTEQVLAEDAGTRTTVDVLKDVRSVVDVRISVWDPEGERWRLLTLAEQQALWALRDR